MTTKLRKPLSIILSVMMILSVFTIIPVTSASAAESPNFVRAATESELDNIGSCTFAEAKAWTEANFDTLNAERVAVGGNNTWLWIVYAPASDAYYSIFMINSNGTLSTSSDLTEDIDTLKVYFNDHDIVYYVKTEDESSYTVTWKNYDGSVLETDEDVAEGATPEYNSNEPTKPEDDENTYEFAGWNDGTTTYAPDTLPAVPGNVTYTATFTATEKPEVIKDCTYQSGDIYANVPIIDVENLAALPDGNLVVLPESGKVTIAYAKCYIFKFYDKTGTELQAVLNEGLVSPGTDLGLSDDVQVYQKEFTLTLTQAAAESGYYIVATEPDSDVSKDCTYSTYLAGDDVVCHANVPLTGSIETLEVLLDGTLCIMSAERDSFGIMDTKGYTYKFYDETGTELTLHSSMSTTSPGSEANLGDDVTIYDNVYDSGFPNGCTDVFIVATVPAPTYTVTWKNWDGSVLETDADVAEGTTPSYDGATPAKADDSVNTYEFAGWNDGTTTYAPDTLPAVTGDVTYTATFTATEKPDVIKDCTYKHADRENAYANVPFIIGDDFSELPNGAIFAGPGEVQEIIVVDSKGYSYKFYDKNGTELAFTQTKEQTFPGLVFGLGDDVTVKVKNFAYPDGFDPDINTFYIVATVPAPTYTVTWKNYDGFVLETDADVAEGATPEYNGNEPTKPEDEENTYEFAGWTPEITAVTGDITYTATYTATEKPEVIKDCTYQNAGIENVYANVPFIIGDDYSEFPNGAILMRSGPVVYDAKGYSYHFYDKTGTEIPATLSETSTAPGSAVELSDDVTLYKKAFDVTFPEGFDDTKDSIYIVATVPTYTVTWNNYDGTELEKDESVEKDSLPKYDGATPAKAEDSVNTYEFAGWNDGTNTYGLTDTLPNVTADVTYTAVFEGTMKPEVAVAAMINALPTEVTVNDKEAIEAARAAYEALSDEQKALVDADTLAKLTAAEEALAAAADQAAADAVAAMINAIGTVEYNAETKAKLDAARAAYDALTDAQKELVTNAATLTEAEEAFAALKLDPVSYNKDSEEVFFGVVLQNPGDTIDASNTPKNLRFDVTAQCDYENDHSGEYQTDEAGTLWKSVDSFYINDNFEFICYNFDITSRMIPAEGRAFMIYYDPFTEEWHIGDAPAPAANPAGTYTVTWEDYDGKILEVDNDVAAGTVPSYDSEDPTRPDGEYYCYVFAGWGPVVGAANCDTTYTARYRTVAKQEEGLIKRFTFNNSAEVNEMTYINRSDRSAWVWFKNNPGGYNYNDYAYEGNGFIMTYSYIDYGAGAVQADNWMITPAIEIPKFETHMTLRATNANRNYPESLDVCIGSSADPDTMTVIQTIAATTGHDQWQLFDVDLSAYAGQTIYVGFHDSCYDMYEGWVDLIEFRYDEETPVYTVTWKNGDNELGAYGVISGTVPTYNGEVPTKEDDEDYTYTFTGWNDGTTTYALNEALPQVNGDMTFTAVFDSTDKQVAAVISMIAALPAPADVTVGDKDAIEAAGYAFANLTNDQRALVPAASTAKLQAVANAFAAVAKEAADQAAADGVTYLINQIPAEVTADDAEKVENARAAYNMLTDDQKALIDADTLAKLEAAEDALLPNLANNSYVETDTTTLNSEVKLFGVAEGGKPGYKYAFMYKLPGSSRWIILGTKFGDSDQETLFVEKDGTYTVLISVMDSKGNKAAKQFSITVEDTTVVNNSSVDKTEVLCGEKITITGAAEGGEGPYLYTYQVKKPGKSSWTTLGEKYTDATSKEFTAKLSGEYEVRVLVKDSAGFIKSFKTTVTSTGTLLVNNSTISTTTAAVGDSVTLNAVAEEGTAPYRYTYELKKPGETKFKTVGKRGSSNESASFTTDTAGTYEAKVYIQDASNYVTVKTFNITVSE